MRIDRVTILRFHRALDGRAFNPVFRWTERRAPIVVVETRSGVRGVGEAWSRYSDMATVLAQLERLAPALLGCEMHKPTHAVAQACDGLTVDEQQDWAAAAARSALDIAVWDAFAREAGVPVWRLLGGERADCPVYASGGLYRDGNSEADLADEIGRYRQRGFSAYKLKIGALPIVQDMARVAAARGAAGEGVLWVDAVNQLGAATAPHWCDALRPYGVAAFQAPVPFDDLDGMAHLNAHGLPVVAAESEYRASRFRELMARRAVTYPQFCLALCGGFSGGLDLDAMALGAGLRTTPQCFSTSIVQAATLQFAAARPNVAMAEYHGFHDHLAELYEGGCGAVRDGRASAGESPGLGVRIPMLGPQQDGSTVALHRAFAV